MLQISQLFVYPVKSLGGVPVAISEITNKGLKYDRRWMLVDDHLSFVTQREFPQMSLLKVEIGNGFLTISEKNFNTSDLIIPFDELIMGNIMLLSGMQYAGQMEQVNTVINDLATYLK